MKYPVYQENFMMEGMRWYCSTACFIWVLNYFWYTQFNMKDTRDMIKIAKLGKYKYGGGLDEKEIAYALYKLWFDVSLYTGMTEKEFNEYLKKPLSVLKKLTPKKYHKYIKGNYREDGNYNPTRIDLTDVSVLNRYRKKKVYLSILIRILRKKLKKTNDQILFSL